jgi:hypothetical protein
MPWLSRALYGAYDVLGDPTYKAAADRYAVFFIACLYDGAPAFALGGALEPCCKLYREHNRGEDSLGNLYWNRSKAKALFDWLLEWRTDEGCYFRCGYGWRDDQGVMHDDQDVGYSNDLSDVGRGLVGYYQMFKNGTALKHALSLAQYYLNEHEPGSLRGVWSSRLGTWLVGPRHNAGFENIGTHADEVGWGWSAYYVLLFLLRLHDCIADPELKAAIRDRCLMSLRWTFDACQFEDGALGMSGRDDKWLGQTAMSVLQYDELARRGLIDAETRRLYYPKVMKALGWLQQWTRPETLPPDGYVPVTGLSRPWPGWNTSWQFGLAVDGLLATPAIQSYGA